MNPLEKCEKCTDFIFEDVQEYIQRLEAQVPKWISVEDGLPEQTKDEYVLVSCNYNGKIKVETRKMWHIDSSVTHWMPLPEPPKEENTNG